MSLRVEDAEMSKGRTNDSSSSRESSPRRTSKRSFSPASDEGDEVVPPVAFDDTPPPPDRPLLRQPVAFAWSSSTSVVPESASLNTYQAAPDVPSSSVFLPGQAPVMQPEAKRGSTSKKRRTNAYPEQTGRFRLPMSVPPSLSQATHVSPPSQGTFYNAFQIPVKVSARSAGMDYTSSEPTPIQAMQTRFAVEKPKLTVANAKKCTAGVHKAKGKSATHERSPPAPSFLEPSISTSPDHGTESPPSVESPNSRISPEAQVRPPEIEPINVDHAHSQHAQSNLTPNNTGRGHDALPIRPLRMVTLLIQDTRSGLVDHQLAEVKIPLRQAEDPSDGYWADAKLLSEQLQSSPSRIDGPAKVFTLRGRYRQFFLRVSAENKDEFMSANLVVGPDRTIDVFVETLSPPGQLPLPPRISDSNLRRSPTPDSVSPSPTPDVRPFNRNFNNHRQAPRSEYGSRTFASSSRAESLSRSFPPGRRSFRGHSPSDSRTMRSGGYESASGEEPDLPSSVTSRILHALPGYRHESPYSDDEPDEIRRVIVNCVDLLIQQDPGWTDFFRTKAAMQPQRVCDVLKQYRFVRKIGDQWIGQRLPFQSSDHFIEMVHIIEALKIDDPCFMAHCNETLALLELYGPNGKRFEDDRVINMIKDTSRPEYNSKPIKRMLHLMRDLDGKWKRDHPYESSEMSRGRDIQRRES